VEVIEGDERRLGGPFVDEQEASNVLRELDAHGAQDREREVDVRERGAGGENRPVGDDHAVEVDDDVRVAGAEGRGEEPGGGDPPGGEEPCLGQ